MDEIHIPYVNLIATPPGVIAEEAGEGTGCRSVRSNGADGHIIRVDLGERTIGKSARNVEVVMIEVIAPRSLALKVQSSSRENASENLLL